MTRVCLTVQILAKADMRIAALYDQQLVTGEAELQLGRLLRQKFVQTQEALLQVCASEQAVATSLPGRLAAAAAASARAIRGSAH